MILIMMMMMMLLLLMMIMIIILILIMMIIMVLMIITIIIIIMMIMIIMIMIIIIMMMMTDDDDDATRESARRGKTINYTVICIDSCVDVVCVNIFATTSGYLASRIMRPTLLAKSLGHPDIEVSHKYYCATDIHSFYFFLFDLRHGARRAFQYCMFFSSGISSCSLCPTFLTCRSYERPSIWLQVVYVTWGVIPAEVRTQRSDLHCVITVI